MKDWMAADLSKLDLLVVQIDGIHMTGELMLVARPRTPPWWRRSSTVSSRAGSIRRGRG
jgi:hypothetical protein